MKKKSFVYASEADLLSVALFGITAKEWREENPTNRFEKLNKMAISQMKVLIQSSLIKKLK